MRCLLGCIAIVWMMGSACHILAQEAERHTVVVYKPDTTYFKDRTVFKLNFPGLGIGFERVLAANVTLSAELGIWYNYFRIFDRNRDQQLLFYPKLRIDGRYYYNAERRLQRGRNIEGFSANYVCFMLQYLLNPNVLSQDDQGHTAEYWDFRRPMGHGVALSFAWGLQRRFARYGFYDIQLGPQVINGFNQEGEPRVSLVPNLRFGLGVQF